MNQEHHDEVDENKFDEIERIEVKYEKNQTNLSEQVVHKESVGIQQSLDNKTAEINRIDSKPKEKILVNEEDIQ